MHLSFLWCERAIYLHYFVIMNVSHCCIDCCQNFLVCPLTLICILFLLSFPCQSNADLMFGGITIICGIFGTLAGGFVLDKMDSTISNAFKVPVVSGKK